MAEEKWSLEDVTANYLKAKSNGTPEETISWFLDQHGYTPASLKMASERQGKKDGKLSPEELEQGGGFWNTVAEWAKPLAYFDIPSELLVGGAIDLA